MPVAALGRFVERMAAITYSPYYLAVIPVVVGIIRAALEGLVGHPAALTLSGIINFICFYLLIQFLTTSVLSVAWSRSYRQVVGPVSVGLVVAWVPPLLEWLFYNEPGRGYRYAQTFHPFFVADYATIWETIGLWLAVAFAVGFTAILTRSVWRSAVALVGTWATLHVVGYLLYSLAISLSQQPGLRFAGIVGTYNLLAVVVCMLTYIIWNRQRLLPSLLRINHALPIALAAALGARMVGHFYATAVLRGLVMLLASLTIVFANDYFDREQDAREGGTARPVSYENLVVATFFQIMLVATVGVFDRPGVIFVVLFFLVGIAYHHPGMRLKRLFCASYKIEGAAGAAAFLYGVGAVGMGLPGVRAVAALTFGGYALGSMFKDYKDIDQDRAERVGTVYTRYTARGRSARGIHLVVTGALFLGLLVPPIWLLVRGEPVLHAIPLFVLAPVMLASLWLGQNRRALVERSYWCLSLYLFVFLLVAPLILG